MKFSFAALAAMLIAWSSQVPALAAAPRETIKTAFIEAIPNVPGKSLVGVVVNYPPGGATPAHHHERSAFITGYVLSGSIRSQVNHGEVRVYHAGGNLDRAARCLSRHQRKRERHGARELARHLCGRQQRNRQTDDI